MKIKSHLIMTFCFFSLSAVRCSLDSSSESSQVTQVKTFMKLDKKQAEEDLKALTSSEHPLGSDRQVQVRDYIIHKLDQAGIKTYIQTFDAQTPNPILLKNPSLPAPRTLTKKGYNIFALPKYEQKDCVVLMGTHYDTKMLETGPYLGANDSASSTIGVMQILTSLAHERSSMPQTSCAIAGYFFDGEEPVLPEWHDGTSKHPAKIKDHLYGSRHAVEQLKPCKGSYCLPDELGGLKVRALVLLDMIGSPSVLLTMDSNSSPHLVQKAIEFDKKLFQESVIHQTLTPAVEDDHIPFLKKGIPAINLIDFYNLEHWHKVSDVPETISFKSIEKVSQLALSLSLSIAE